MTTPAASPANSSKDAIKQLKAKLKKAAKESAADSILGILDSLSKHEISYALLKETKLGKAVGKLRKHSDSRVAKASTALVEQWRKVIDSQPQHLQQPPLLGTPPLQGSPGVSVKVESQGNGSVGKQENNGSSEVKKRKKSEDEGGSSGDDAKRIKREGSNESSQKTPPSSQSSQSSEQRKRSDRETNDIRVKVVDAFLQILNTPLPAEVTNVRPTEEVAKEIEEEMFKLFGGCTKDYLAKKRTLQFNLRNPKYPDLRLSVLQGSLTASKLCTMTPLEMASPELREMREKAAAYWTEAAKSSQLMNQVRTDMFKCGKCQGRDTTYWQMQTRSADEPMTTFHTCVKCGNKWKS